MKKLILCITVVMSLAGSLWASDGALDIAEPEYAGNILYVFDGKGVPLEKQKASNKVRGGFFKVKGSNIIKGAFSPVRVKEHSELQFVVKATTNEVDPVQIINIFKLVRIKDQYRSIETSSSGPFTGSSMDIDFITFESRKYGKSSYLIKISQTLSAGEYAMTMDGSRDLFNMFGVD